VTCRPKRGICHAAGVAAWGVVHTLPDERDGLLLNRALHTLEMTAMFKRMFVSQDDPIRDSSLLESPMEERIVRDWRPTPLSPRPLDLRREQRKWKALDSSGNRDLLPSSVPSASLHAQLDSLLYARWLPGRWVQRVWMLSDLPPRLEQRARSISSDAIWRAYTDGARLWFAVAAAAVSTYGQSAVAMEVLFFENDGALCSGGLWRCHPNGDWGLERLVDMSTGSRFY